VLAGIESAASVIRRFRAADGRMRVDFGSFSILTDPASIERIVLDHVAMEARILLDAVPSIPGVAIPNVPSVQAEFGVTIPSAPNLVALGKTIVDGLEVEGVRFVFQVLDPLIPPPILSWEVWTSVSLQMPVLTRTIGSFGVRTCTCKCVQVEPPPQMFQIPSGYAVIREPLPL